MFVEQQTRASDDRAIQKVAREIESCMPRRSSPTVSLSGESDSLGISGVMSLTMIYLGPGPVSDLTSGVDTYDEMAKR